ARLGVLELRRDQRRYHSGGPALRLDVEPQLRRSPGQGRPHPPHVARHGGGVGGHRSIDGSPLAGGTLIFGPPMIPFTTLTDVAAPLDMAYVDTDRILPARFLRKPRGPDFGRYAFHDLRFDEQGDERPDFVLNR